MPRTKACRVWSWDERHNVWMEVARGTASEMADALQRKRAAAARLLPSARFCMTTVDEFPEGPPDAV